ncbi:pirin family protein, partial [bacterium]|nr:pirin family protein [bacterium]
MSWKVRKSSDRGHFDHGWLKTYHSFSFSQYWDRNWMGYRALRVINEDWVAAGEGFDPHPHDNMEIVTLVLEGALQHQDSMGNGSVIGSGDIQRMSAGTGIVHSEFNASKTDTVHLYQIWIRPEHEGVSPSYEQKHCSVDKQKNRLLPIVLPVSEPQRRGVASEQAVLIHQDAVVYTSTLDAGIVLTHAPKVPRYYWLQVVSGSVQVDNVRAQAGDAIFSDAPVSETFSISSENL